MKKNVPFHKKSWKTLVYTIIFFLEGYIIILFVLRSHTVMSGVTFGSALSGTMWKARENPGWSYSGQTPYLQNFHFSTWSKNFLSHEIFTFVFCSWWIDSILEAVKKLLMGSWHEIQDVKSLGIIIFIFKTFYSAIRKKLYHETSSHELAIIILLPCSFFLKVLSTGQLV